MSTEQGTLDIVANIPDPGTASLVHAVPPRIQVHDGEFNMVAKGFGTLKREFDPGLYFVRVELVDKPYERVVRVPPNGTATVTYPANTSPRSSSAAVVEGTASLHEYTSDYTRALSKTKAKLTLGSVRASSSWHRANGQIQPRKSDSRGFDFSTEPASALPTFLAALP